MTKTTIPWATDVWNPIVGCTKVSAGCANCYAEALHNRRHEAYLKGAKLPAQYAKPFSEIQLLPERLEEPAHWKKPRQVFVDSMSDLFHPDVPDEFITQVFGAMQEAHRHTFIVLTKRPKRLLDICLKVGFTLGKRNYLFPVPDNVWIVVSIEDQRSADERIPYLLRTPAAVRGVSIEPMLEKIDLTAFRYDGVIDIDALNGVAKGIYNEYPFPSKDVKAWPLDWVIAGFESGANARVPADQLAIARFTRDQCVAAGVPFFFKQMWIDGRLVHMPALDGQVWAQYPEGK